jgi:hypothetical protein
MLCVRLVALLVVARSDWNDSNAMIMTAMTASRKPIKVFGGNGRRLRMAPNELFELFLESMARSAGNQQKST